MYQRGPTYKTQEQMTANPGKYPQGYFKPKPCRTCGTKFEPEAPSHLYCSQTCNEEGFTRNYLHKTYGLTLEEFQDMHDKQNGLCAICKSEGFIMAKNGKFKLVVDHCHKTGVVRGLLCHNCNRALGLLQDSAENLKSALDYLERATTIRKEYIPSKREWKRTTRSSSSSKKRDDIV